MTRYLAAVAVVLASASSLFAGPQRYELKRVNMGPRSDQFILVRVHEQSTQPFALTGNAERPRPVRHFPSHMKGTHGPF